MAARTGKRILWLVIAGLAIAAWQLGPRLLQKRAGTERLVNQLWVERTPNDERDLVAFGLWLEKDDKRQGLFGRASRWRSRTEGFVWALNGNQLRARFPQDNQTMRGQVRTWRCEGEVPRPFQWCLEIQRGQKRHRLYSRDNWRVRPHDGVVDDSDARAELGWMASGLRPVDGVALEEVGDEPESVDSAFDQLAPPATY
jgi:hypothetical protein